jgi:hypothetical protein
VLAGENLHQRRRYEDGGSAIDLCRAPADVKKRRSCPSRTSAKDRDQDVGGPRPRGLRPSRTALVFAQDRRADRALRRNGRLARL